MFVSVVIADDHPLIREGIKRLVEHAFDMEVAGEASDGHQAIELIQNKKPDIIILDLQMPVRDGIQVMDYRSEVRSTVIILVLSAQSDPAIVQETLSKGAWGYYLKEDAPIHLIQAIRQAITGASKSFSPHFASLGFSFP